MKRESGHRDEMPYISVRQPWAWLIMEGHKDIENRNAVSHHRGELLIHASSNRTGLKKRIEEVEEDYGISVPEEELEFGSLIGSVIMKDCVDDHDSPWFYPGGYGYVLADPIRITPIPLKANAGMQRTYDIDVIYEGDGLLKRLRRKVRKLIRR